MGAAVRVGCSQPCFLQCSGLAHPCCSWIEVQEAQAQCEGSCGWAGMETRRVDASLAWKIFIPPWHLLGLWPAGLTAWSPAAKVSPFQVLAGGRGEWMWCLWPW